MGRGRNECRNVQPLGVQWWREFQLLNAGADEQRSHIALFCAKNVLGAFNNLST